jgi:adenosylcobinamide-phosphate synthase
MGRLAGGGWIGAGWLADRVLGEPPAAVHPVALFGTAMGRIERLTYRPTRSAGAAHVAVGVGGALAAAALARALLGSGPATAAATAASVAGRMLGAEAGAVLAAVEAGDLAAARCRVPSLVGRDPEGLAADDLVRAVIESLAENTVDAVVAPLFWAAVAGAPGVLGHRAVNTLDAMIGHRDQRYERFGWAAARLDDAANYVPARLAAAGIALLAPARAAAILAAVRRDAPAHPSPNGGVIEAAVAAALGVQLGGANRYGDRVEHRGVLGRGRPPTVSDGRRAIRLTAGLGALAAAAAAVAPAAIGRRRHG